MSRLVEERQLPCPAGEAASLVLDWSRDAEWRGAVTAMQVDPPGRAREGQRITEWLRFAGRTYVTPTVVTSVDGMSAAFAGASATVAVRGRRSVVPAGEDRCTVVLEVDVRMTGVLAVLNPLLTPGYRRRHAADADALGTWAGRRAGSPAPSSQAGRT